MLTVKPPESAEDPRAVNKIEKNLGVLRDNFFLSPDGHNVEVLVELVRHALTTVIGHQGEGPIYPSFNRPHMTKVAKEAVIPERMTLDPHEILDSLPLHMQGSVKASSPFMVKNIIPLPAFIHLATNLAVSLYMPNGVTGEDAAEVLNAEIACASAIAKLADLDPEKASGIFTFGGTGTNLYGLKMGIYKADPLHGMEGVGKNIVVVGSKPSHYSHQTAVNWLGIGQNSYLQVDSHPDQTTKLDELSTICNKAIESGKRIACIEALGGTTSNMAIDDFQAICEIRNGLVAKYDLDYVPHIHADTVLGWAYLNFMNYDFDKNELGLSQGALDRIQKIIQRLSSLHCVDSFGVDFHKTGYMPYISSMVITKRKEDLTRLRRDGKVMTPLFHDNVAYNPGTFTLETSRSSANILATWLTLNAFGQEGYQTLLGHSIEISEKIRACISAAEQEGLLVVNQEPFGCDVFVRCYKQGQNPSKTHEKELIDDSVLEENNHYLNGFAKCLLSERAQNENNLSISKSSAASYTHTGAPLPALRIYPLNPFITEDHAVAIVEKLIMAKKTFDHT